jgi:lysophospholipase L1-like esterase
MAKICPQLYWAAMAILMATGCSNLSLPKLIIDKPTSTSPVVSVQAQRNCVKVDPFAKAIDRARSAANLAQSAQSAQQWDGVILQWLQAIANMQAVGLENPRRAYAQKKVAEYSQNLAIARQKAASLTTQLPFASFENQIFDEQLRLYLSYVAAFGTPDVLIVGSSRALVGVDPQVLQQALAAQGKKGLRVFNLGINGGTAQTVDLQLRQILTRDKLPRLIVWADGLRAFNSGRPDRTYNSLIASAGYKRLQAGTRPTLPQSTPQAIDSCEDIPGTSQSLAQTKALLASNTSTTDIAPLEASSESSPVPSSPFRLTQATGTPVPQRLTTDYSSAAIDASGFLPINSRFDPNVYYQKTPRVSGRFDSDYQPFSLSGAQIVAFNAVQNFAKQQKIALVLVNLPLTDEYLDSIRQSREQQFQQYMQGQVGDGFMFVNLVQQWPTQYQYFTDPSHLNRNGAAAVANLLAANRQIPWPQARP